VFLLALAALSLVEGCASTSCVGATCQCSATTCDWNQIGSCSSDSDGCTLSCNEGGHCTGACGTRCTTSCNEASSCDLSSGDGAILSCNGTASCEYHAGASAKLSCNDSATCTFTVGDNGSVSCNLGTACHVLCTGSCALTCDSSVCDLTCPGDTKARSVHGVVSCPGA
jgi:hypothetical protein